MKIEVGIVSSPGCSNTIAGLFRSPACSQIAFPNAFAPENHFAHASESSQCGGLPQRSYYVLLMYPTAPRFFVYSPFSSEETTVTAFAPAAATSWVASDQRPPAPPQTRTTSPSWTVLGAQPWSIRYAVAPVSVGAAASSHVRCGAFGMSWCACTLQNCANEPHAVS